MNFNEALEQLVHLGKKVFLDRIDMSNNGDNTHVIDIELVKHGMIGNPYILMKDTESTEHFQVSVKAIKRTNFYTQEN